MDEYSGHNWVLHVGHVLDVLKQLPERSVQCCVTSPPYWGLRDYGLPPSVWGGDPDCDHQWGEWHEDHDVREETTTGKTRTTDRFYGDESRRFNGNHQKHTAGTFCFKCNAWLGCYGLEPTPELFVEHTVLIFREARRVLRDDGTLWLNYGDSYTSGGRDSFGTFSPESKQATHSAIISAPRAPQPIGLKPKDLVGIPWRVAFALQADGWYLRADVVWSKPNPMPESVTDRPSKSHEYIFLLAKSERYFYDSEAVKEQTTGNAHDRGNGVNPKAFGPNSRVNRDHTPEHQAPGRIKAKQNRSFSAAVTSVVSSRNLRTVWSIATQPYAEAHFATFPEKLPARCILAGTSERGCCPECGAPWKRIVVKDRVATRPGNNTKVGRVSDDDDSPYHGQHGSIVGNRDPQRHTTTTATAGWEQSCDCEPAEPIPCTVLEPFAGSGTTLKVARDLGRQAIGIELSADYAELAEKRIMNLKRHLPKGHKPIEPLEGQKSLFGA